MDIIIVESFRNGDLTQTCGIKIPIRVAVVTLLVPLVTEQILLTVCSTKQGVVAIIPALFVKITTNSMCLSYMIDCKELHPDVTY